MKSMILFLTILASDMPTKVPDWIDFPYLGRVEVLKGDSGECCSDCSFQNADVRAKCMEDCC